MGKTNKVTAYESFETRGYIKDNHHYFDDMQGNRRADSKIGITTSMMLSPAFLELTPQQRFLYMIAKYQYYNAPDKPCDHSDSDIYKGKAGKQYIYLNIKLTEVFNVYGKNNRGFYKDIKALVSHGFLKPIERENNQRTIYQLSSEWANYEPGMCFMETNPHQHRWEWVRQEMV